MKKLLVLLLLSFAVNDLYSQVDDISYPHVVPMTPNAAQLAKYADHQVSHYTGTANINIPLYEIDLGDFKLPINLTYHPSGIRVNQEATWVGLGWALDVGSRISRAVKGTDDFLTDGRDRSYPNVESGYYDAPDIPSTLANHYTQIITPGCGFFGSIGNYLKYDPEPDIFYYNLPGMNGKFILDKSRGAVLFDKSHNLKIEVIRHPSLMVDLKITDAKGNQYFYTQYEITKTYASNGWLNKNVHDPFTVYDSSTSTFTQWTHVRYGDCVEGWDPSNQNPYPMVTSWCLTKIITKELREVNFTYEAELQSLPTQEACENYNFNSQSALYYSKSKVVNNALRLTAIYGDFGRVDFTGDVRYDIAGDSKKLASITVRNKANELVKDYRFTYSYFNDDYSGTYDNVFKRLKLDNVTEYSATNQPLNSGHSFSYYPGSLPPKNSKNVDYWGFQNGKEYGSNYYIGIYLSNNVKYLGVKKDANFQYALIGTLKSITYPTRGVEEYVYESHTIPFGYFETHTADEASSTSTVTLPVYKSYIYNEYPDIPDNRIHSFELLGQTFITIKGRVENIWGQRDPDYIYNSTPLGKLRRVSPTPQHYTTYECPPVFFTSIPQGQGEELMLTERGFTLEAGTYEFEAYPPPKEVLADWQLHFSYSYRPTPQIPPEGVTKGGGIRIKEIRNQAKVRNFKYAPGTMLSEPVLYYVGRRAGIPDYIAGCNVQVSESKSPLSTFNNGNVVGYDWVEEYMTDEDGNVSKTRYSFYNDTESDAFDDNFPESPRYINYRNGLVKSVVKYKNTTLVAKDEFDYASTLSALIPAFMDKGQRKYSGDVLQYHYQVEWPLRSSMVNTTTTDEGIDIVAETSYTYNSRNLLSSTKYVLGQAETLEQLKYPFDLSDPVSLSMVNRNMVGSPVYKETFKDNKKTSTSQTIYRDWGAGLIAPEIVKISKGTEPLEERLKYNVYDTKGNILEVQQVDGMKVSYIWGYNSTQPVAKLENIAYADIPQNLISAIQSATDLATPSEMYVRNALTALRQSSNALLQKAFITTITYKPLVGMTSMTDSKGMTTYYEYDSFGRLKTEKDHNGRVLKTFNYNYKGL